MSVVRFLQVFFVFHCLCGGNLDLKSVANKPNSLTIPIGNTEIQYKLDHSFRVNAAFKFSHPLITAKHCAYSCNRGKSRIEIYNKPDDITRSCENFIFREMKCLEAIFERTFISKRLSCDKNEIHVTCAFNIVETLPDYTAHQIQLPESSLMATLKGNSIPPLRHYVVMEDEMIFVKPQILFLVPHDNRFLLTSELNARNKNDVQKFGWFQHDNPQMEDVLRKIDEKLLIGYDGNWYLQGKGYVKEGFPDPGLPDGIQIDATDVEFRGNTVEVKDLKVENLLRVDRMRSDITEDKFVLFASEIVREEEKTYLRLKILSKLQMRAVNGTGFVFHKDENFELRLKQGIDDYNLPLLGNYTEPQAICIKLDHQDHPTCTISRFTKAKQQSTTSETNTPYTTSTEVLISNETASSMTPDYVEKCSSDSENILSIILYVYVALTFFVIIYHLVMYFKNLGIRMGLFKSPSELLNEEQSINKLI